MKRFLNLFAFLILFSMSLFAQSKFYVAGGLDIPSKPKSFADNWDSGITFGVGKEYMYKQNICLTVGMDLNYFRFYNSSNLINSLGVSGWGMNVSSGNTITANIHVGIKATLININNIVAPYITGSVGLLGTSFGDINLSTIDGYSINRKGNSEFALSSAAGGGFDIPVGETTDIFIECQYVIGFTKGESTAYLPIRIGLQIGQ
jgi:hypothetical protein